MCRNQGAFGRLAAAMLASLAMLAPPADAQQPASRPPPPGGQRPDRPQNYSIEQAISDQAQLHTIAFSGLAFISGDFAASTFMPPGKVADFFGFQYMRDIDAAGKGHNPMFLDRVAGNVLRLLDAEQRALFEQEARAEATQMRELALRRLPLIAAFHQQLSARYPAGSSGIDKASVMRFTGDLFADDAALSYQRASVFGRIVASLSESQRAALARMRFGDFNSWPTVDMEQYKLGRGTEKMVNVAYMTLASEFFSWYAGSLQADTYFCPERHGTYFGGFFLKDAPAMGKRDYDISTSLTGDLGQEFLNVLTPSQRQTMTGILDTQRRALHQIVETRRAIASELRGFLRGATPDRNRVISLGRRYGELDGELAFIHAMAYARIGQSLSGEQRRALMRMRGDAPPKPAVAYLYADPLRDVPSFDATALFYPPR